MMKKELPNYKVIGFTRELKHIIFFKDNEYICIKSSLPKVNIIAKLDVSPSKINKNFKDEIYEQARKGGIKQKVYSLDGINYQRSSLFNTATSGLYEPKFGMYVSIDVNYPEKLDEKIIKPIIDCYENEKRASRNS
jgi:hypothetical protein